MANSLTWGEALDYTIEHQWHRKAGLKTNLINTGHFTAFAGRSFPVEHINQAQIDLFKQDLQDERYVSDATVNRCVTAVATAINCCALRGMCDKAPKFVKYDEGDIKMDWFTQEEVDRMSAAAVDPYMRPEIGDALLTAAYTGMRQGELLKLRAMDIDLDARNPRFHIGGVPHLKTKAKNYRTVPIHPRLMDMLHKRLEYAGPSVKVFDDVGNKDQLLRAFKKVRKWANAPEYRWHDLRHSFGTWHAIAGTPMRTLMAMMGHKTIEMTLRYAKHTDSAAIAAMGNI